MKNVLDFVQFGLSHANPSTVPSGAVMPYSVGDGGVWRYLYGTHGQVCTQTLLDRSYKAYYETHGMSREEFDKITKGWVENGYHVSDCNGLLDAYEGFDVNCQTTYTKYCAYKGKVDEIDRPFCLGEAVFMGKTAKKHTSDGCADSTKTETRLCSRIAESNMDASSPSFLGADGTIAVS